MCFHNNNIMPALRGSILYYTALNGFLLFRFPPLYPPPIHSSINQIMYCIVLYSSIIIIIIILVHAVDLDVLRVGESIPVRQQEF
ncbi:hypothetical protein HOY80DRAFT_959050 [Tuber brumale]|nr:hypothetical protein HOY80DRAFT_959050 [Tuber brumale]